MIALLVRRHLAHPGVLLLVAAGTVILVVTPSVVATSLLPFLLLMACRTIPQRTDAFEAALPISGREVVMARALATLIPMIIPVAVWFMASLLRVADGDVLTLEMETVLLVALAILVPNLLTRGSIDDSPGASPVIAWIGLAVVAGGVMWLLSPGPAAAFFAFGVAATLTLLWSIIPDALQLAPAAAPPLSSRRSERSESGMTFPDTRSRHLPRAKRRSSGGMTTLLRSAVSGIAVVLWLVVIAMAALGNESYFTYFWIAVLSISATMRVRTRWMAALPLSHRARLLAIVVPAVVVTAGCVALGAVIELPFPPRREWLTREAPSTSAPDRWDGPTRVSIDHWRRAATGTAPVITAPWGEHAVADTATVFGVTLYNPWTSTADNTPRFVEWQHQRATADVYGRPMTRDEYRAAGPRPPRAAGDARAWLVNAAFLLTLGLVVLLVSELGYSHRRRLGSRATVVVQWLGALPLMALIIADAAYRVRGGGVVILLLHRALLDLGALMPSNAVLAVVVAGLPVAAAYALLERQFRRSESALVAEGPGG